MKKEKFKQLFTALFTALFTLVADQNNAPRSVALRATWYAAGLET